MNAATLCLGCMEDDSGAEVCPRCSAPRQLPARNPLQLPPRTVLHNLYIVGRALGHGGFGITYLAWDTASETRVAIKEYLPHGIAGRSVGDTMVLPYEQTQREFHWGLDRFLVEARTLQRFSALDGIVSVETLFSENGTAYLVMEYLDGWTLEEFLRGRGGFVPMQTAMRAMIPVMDALSAIHAEGILHRDISPDNIYLTRSAKVKLIDFGAARNALGQRSRNLSIILKEGYAPEEQYRASGIQGPWTDVYATAATLYHAITGKVPQPALDRQVRDRLEPPSALGIRLPRSVEAALIKALAVRSADRYQSMQDFKAALTGEAEAIVVRPQPQPAPVPMQPAPPQRMYAVPPLAPAFPPPPQPVRPPRARWIWPVLLALIALIAILVALSRSAPGSSRNARPIAVEARLQTVPEPRAGRTPARTRGARTPCVRHIESAEASARLRTPQPALRRGSTAVSRTTRLHCDRALRCNGTQNGTHTLVKVFGPSLV
jgi:serine/threonine protein kinase